MRDNDTLQFADENPSDIRIPETRAAAPWKILIVDDDQDVHEATVFALKGSLVLGRPLSFLHAYSAAEAVAVLKQHPDTALALLDAVMETETAGLDTVKTIRNELGMEELRIILRTGQPGQVPELETIARYDINDYKTKSELTKTKLMTTVIAALRSWQQLHRINANRLGLEKIIEASNQFLAETGLTRFAEGVITQMAGLFGVEPEGIVCAAGSRNSRYVIAAAGRCSHLMNRSLDEIENREIAESIDEVLRTKTNRVGTHSLTVYFDEPSGKQYAVWIGSPTPIREINSRLLEVFCTNISLCASNIELVDRLKAQAWEDQTLGIPNMTALLEKIDLELGSGAQCPELLVLLDIDGFNQINDLLGHAYGDEILRSFAVKLREVLGGEAYIARVASDVFGILGCRRLFTENLLKKLSVLTIRTPDGERDLSVSIGVAELSPLDGDASTHLRNGFVALKRAKGDGVGQVVEYSAKIGNATRERIRLLHALRGAFAENKLFLMFQPQAEIATGRVFCMEALLRWRNDQGEYIPPDRFIPLAEQGGLIVAMGTWILRMALLALREFQDAGFPNLNMAVNISVMQMRHPGFLAMIDEALRDSGIDPRHLELEITESISMLGIDDALKILDAVRERGISLAIDDFGIGYSSLSSLDRWPVNRLKIDKSFIQQIEVRPQSVRLVDMVIPLGSSLDLRVIAEGVETQAQLEHLRKNGCHEVQGFLLSRPLMQDQVVPWLNSRAAVWPEA